MNIAEALQSYSNYPVPQPLLARVSVERGFSLEQPYDTATAVSKSYRLAKADVFYYYGTSPDIKEGDISITLTEKTTFLSQAQAIYDEYNDTTKSGIIEAGYIGENF